MTSITLALLFVAVAVQCAYAGYPGGHGRYCGNPYVPDYGGYHRQSKYYSVGYRVNYYCNKGYYHEGSRWAVCTYKNKRIYWAYPYPYKPPKCVRKCNLSLAGLLVLLTDLLLLSCPRLRDLP